MQIKSGCHYALLAAVLMSCSPPQDGVGRIQFIPHATADKVDVMVDGALFTSYMYGDTLGMLTKPVLYPLMTVGGKRITRAYPLEKRPGERLDHPHQVGFWLSYGDVNGIDFWNHSGATPAAQQATRGRIRHTHIKSMSAADSIGMLEVSMNWEDADSLVLLQEDTRFRFTAHGPHRLIERRTTLTAMVDEVHFQDNKEGFVAVRVASTLEHASNQTPPNDDVNAADGIYTSSTGINGTAVWGTRASWVMLNGTIADEPITLVLFDHPENIGTPTYWHARGYGLFAANPLGQNIFSQGKEKLNLRLHRGESATFIFHVLVFSGTMQASDVAEYAELLRQP